MSGGTSHDQLLKEVLARFLPDFVTLFAPQQAALLDFATLRLLEKEVFTDVAAGQRRELDLLAEVAAREGTPHLVLIHVEIQRRRQAEFAHRMLRYFMAIHLRYPEHAILPFALLSFPQEQGLGIGTARLGVAGFTALEYHYIEISLPRLAAAEYVRRPQPLAAGLAALMEAPDREEVYAACQRRLAELEEGRVLDDAHLFLLQNLVRTYLALTEGERARVLARLQAEGAMNVVTSEMTWADRVRLEGHTEGEVDAILTVLRERFGTVPATVEERVRATREAEALTALLVRALRITSPDEL